MLSDLVFRFRSLFRSRAAEAELDDELRFHAEQQRDKYVKSGMTRDEASRLVRMEFGGIDQVKEDCREARGVEPMETLFKDVLYALRTLRKTPRLHLRRVADARAGDRRQHGDLLGRRRRPAPPSALPGSCAPDRHQ